MKNINNSNLDSAVAGPTYDRKLLKTKIVHIGFGAFHRAHQNVFTDDVARRSQSDWGVCAISLFSEKPIIALRDQDHLFSVAEIGAESTSAKIIGCLTQSLHPKLDGAKALIEKMAEPQIAIVSLTITEKGYCLDPATGKLNKSNPAIITDMETPTEPTSALGFITQALKLRKERGLASFSVMSCDNIQDNGKAAKTAIVEFAKMQDTSLAKWIDEEVTFPSTMVDRITPAMNEQSFAQLDKILGAHDPCGILCEPFNQWVIEDKFTAGRPDWNIAGAQFVEDVSPYEEMKLRMLNGAHSFLAYLGFLSSFEHISDTMQNAAFKKAAYDMMINVQAPTLNMPKDTNLKSYANQLIERFENPNLKHKTWQIAMDGSQKIPQRWGNGLLYHLEHGSDFEWIAAGIAGWIRYVSGTNEQGEPIEVKDPMAKQLREICDAHAHNISVVPAVLSLEMIFDTQIGKNPKVVATVSKIYQSLLDIGAHNTVSTLISERSK